MEYSVFLKLVTQNNLRMTYYSHYFDITLPFHPCIHSMPKRAKSPKVVIEEIEKVWSLQRDRDVYLYFPPGSACLPLPRGDRKIWVQATRRSGPGEASNQMEGSIIDRKMKKRAAQMSRQSCKSLCQVYFPMKMWQTRKYQGHPSNTWRLRAC